MEFLFPNLAAKAQNIMEHGSTAHQWDHVLRVWEIAMTIGTQENANMRVVEVAALLHDIGRNAQDESKGKVCHAQAGALLAPDLLVDTPLLEEEKKNIVHCIASHRVRADGKAKDRLTQPHLFPQTLEAQVLFDADKLDAIGAVGIGRYFMFAGKHGARLHNSPWVDPLACESYSKEDTAWREYLIKTKDLQFYTHTANVIAQKRLDFMKHFFEELIDEVEGRK